MAHIKNFLVFIVYFLVKLPMELLSFIIVPIGCLFVKNGRLPKVISWFDEYDYGTDGDEGWKLHAQGKEVTWRYRVRFLLRNRINTFCKVVQGVRTSDIETISYRGDTLTSNYPGHSGFLFIEAVTKSGKKYQEYYYVRRWGNSRRCIRMRFGWKLKDMLEEYLEDGILNNRKTREFAQFVFAPSFTMGYYIPTE